MPKPQRIFADRDLRDLHRTVRRSFTDSYSQDFPEEPQPEPAPQVVIARIPLTGIPAATFIEGAYQFSAGYADCELFYFKDNAETILAEDPLTKFELTGDYNYGGAFRLTAMTGPSGAPHKELIYNPYPWKAYGKSLDEYGGVFIRTTRERSGRWVCDRPPTTLKCKPTETILPNTPLGTEKNVEIWLGGVATGSGERAYLNWMHSSESLAIGSEQIIDYFYDERKWVFRKSSTGASGIPFYNNSGEIIPPYAVIYAKDVLRINDVSYLEALNISTPFHYLWLVNGPTPIPVLGTGLGKWLTDGVGPVAVDTSLFSPAWGHEWGPKPGSSALWPFRQGFMALGDVYTLDGVEVADFRQRNVSTVFGKLYDTLTQNAGGTGNALFDIYYRASDGTIAPAGWDMIPVYAQFLQNGKSIDPESPGSAEWDTDHWEADFRFNGPSTPTAPQTIYYYAYKKVKGFAADIGGFGTAILDSTHLTAWTGAIAVVGDETEVGIEFDSAEADPDVNGNFLITKTGVFKVEFTGSFKIRLGNTSPTQLTTVVVVNNLYRKPIAGGGIGDLVDSFGGVPIHYGHKIEQGETGSILFTNMTAQGYFFATAGDRLALRWQISSDTSIPSNCAVSLNFPFVSFTYLQEDDMLATNAAF